MKKALTVLVAAAAGVAAGVLMAPKSGKETREDIKRKANTANDQAHEKAARVKSAVKDGYNSVKTTANEVKEEAGVFATHAKTSARELADDAKARSSRVNDKAKHTARDLKHDADSVRK